jgi:hypothetical protein
MVLAITRAGKGRMVWPFYIPFPLSAGYIIKYANEGKISWEAYIISYGNLYRLWQVKLPVGLLLIRSWVLGNEAYVSRNGDGHLFF